MTKVTSFVKDDFKLVKLNVSELNTHISNFILTYKDKSKETQGTYKRSLHEFIYFFTTDGKFRFTVKDVERYKLYLQQKSFSSNTVGTYMTSLRRFCNFLKENGVLDKNPATRVVGAKRPSVHSRKWLTLTELQTLWNSLIGETENDRRDRALVHIMFGCQVSEAEISKMMVADLYQEGKKYLLKVQGKGKDVKDETIVVPNPVVESIQHYLDIREAITPDQPLFRSHSNRNKFGAIQVRAMRGMVNNRLNLCGVKKNRDKEITPFSLRHSAAIIIAESGASVEYLMKRLRITWRPTALMYVKLKGRIASQGNEDITRYVLLQDGSASADSDHISNSSLQTSKD